MRHFLTAALLLIATSSVSTAQINTDTLVDDHYTIDSYKIRKPLRGDWKIENGIAAVTQDDELYKKHKNHGPIMVYEVPHDDASAEVVFKSTGCKAVVFTMDATNGGHAFRIKLSPKSPGSVLTYIKEPGANKATPVFLNKTLPTLTEEKWETLKVKVVGDKATVQLGDSTINVQHEMIDQPKKIAKLGFSFGSLELNKFHLSAVK
ncbi:hypothetical protein [Planctomycetes bacterium K23_9]|uniref:3-keto-disaccharide hydrolase domain-containing protein n=1 Tax=Stieleria marina TaxID=1930275 RepID=A0A517NN83_9BACT|nr:hypothetical protein K239x_05030 [Planctomycetes bacterium K23_9]